jgi:serine protease Do
VLWLHRQPGWLRRHRQPLRHPGPGIEIAIIDAFFQEQLDEGVFTEADVDELYDEAAENWTVEGAGAIGTPVDLTLTEVWPTVAASGIQVSQPFEAVVSKSTPVSTGGDDSGLAGGDVALLKIDTQGVDLPALELAPEEPETGEAVTSIGFPGSVEDVVDPTLEPSAKSGTVSSSQNVEGAPFTEISSAMSGGMSGGPTVDSQGRVIGVNSFGPTGEEESFNFVTGTDSLDALYAQFDIPRELNSTDTAYRAGLDSYFAEDYDAAVEQFDTVLASQPNHAQAQKYRSEAAQAAPAESDSSSAPIVPIAAGLVVLGAGTAGFFIYRSRRKPPTPPAPPTWTAVPDPGLPDPQEQAREADRRVAGW